MRFASDNTSGAAPEIMSAILKANEGYERSYGADAAMARVTELVRELFEAPEAEVRLVATGTAANALAIATHVQPWDGVFCHRLAHIAEDECNAPEAVHTMAGQADTQGARRPCHHRASAAAASASSRA